MTFTLLLFALYLLGLIFRFLVPLAGIILCIIMLKQTVKLLWYMLLGIFFVWLAAAVVFAVI